VTNPKGASVAKADLEVDGCSGGGGIGDDAYGDDSLRNGGSRRRADFSSPPVDRVDVNSDAIGEPCGGKAARTELGEEFADLNQRAPDSRFLLGHRSRLQKSGVKRMPEVAGAGLRDGVG